MVFDAIRGIFGKKEEQVPVRDKQTLTLEELPDWLVIRRGQAASDLASGMSRFRDSFLSHEQVLARLVESLPVPDPKAEASPKVRTVIEKSYPQFKRAIASQIVTDFPDDPEVFYKIVTESLKGCVSALKGPGKYLHLLFPDQMKVIRERISDMGREVNELTKLLAGHREVMNQADRAEELLKQIQRRQDHHEHLGSKYEEHQQKVLLLEKRVKGLETEYQKICGEPGYQVLQGLENDLKKAIELENRAFEEYRVMSSAALHVMKRASKVVERKPGHEEDEQALADTMLALDNIEPPAIRYLEEIAAPAGRVVFESVESGDIQLKNREERELFANEHAMTDCIAGRIRSYSGARADRERADKNLGENPLSARLETCQSELRDARQQLSREEVHGHQIDEKQRQFEESGPDSVVSLEKILSSLARTNVTIQQK